MEFLSQIDSHSEPSGAMVFVIALMAIFIIAMLAWHFKISQDFDAAKEDFENNPTSGPVRQRLIAAAKAKNDEGYSTNTVLAMLEQQRERERQRELIKSTPKKAALVSELKSLADLKTKGLLTEDEFEKAKIKLLD